MAVQWLRLWHDMPNDPKWRTIARVSGRPISEVVAVYIHLLVSASNATERGRTQTNANEHIASALDVEESDIDAIMTAMDGRVLDGDQITGWEKRQPKREDGAAERAREWRRTQTNANERKRTLDKDKDKEEEKKEEPLSVKPDEDHRKYDSIPYVDLVGAYHNLCPSLPKVREVTDKRRKALKAGWKKYEKHDGGFPAILDTLFKKAEQSDFLTGRDGRWLGAGFDWLLKEANMVKVIEGNYDNKDAGPTKNKFGKTEPQHHGAAYKMIADLTLD